MPSEIGKSAKFTTPDFSVADAVFFGFRVNGEKAHQVRKLHIVDYSETASPTPASWAIREAYLEHYSANAGDAASRADVVFSLRYQLIYGVEYRRVFPS